MNIRKVIYGISVFLLISIVLMTEVLADPVIINPLEYPFDNIILLIVLFHLTLGIEFLILYFSLLKESFEKYTVFRPVLLVNLVTFPSTQIIFVLLIYWFPEFFFLSILLIETGVILIEWFLYRFEFKDISNLRILGITFLANLASFLVGLVITLAIGGARLLI